MYCYCIDKEDKKVEDIYLRQCMTCHKIYGCKSKSYCLTCLYCVNGKMPNTTMTEVVKVITEYTTGECSDCFKDYTRTRILEKKSENIEILVDRRLAGHTKKKNRIRIRIGRI